jgi:hypothetical protein
VTVPSELLWFYTLAAFGFCWIVGHSTLSLPLRQRYTDWSKGGNPDALDPLLITLAECPACLGFWVGFAVGVFCALRGGAEAAAPSFAADLRAVGAGVLLGCYTSGVNYVLGRLTGLITDEE